MQKSSIINFQVLSSLLFIFNFGGKAYAAVSPAIYGVEVKSITATTAVITWGTTVPMNAKVVYGATTSYGGSKYIAELDTYRQIKITGLKANSTYHYRLSNKDANNVYIQSGDFTFKTAPATPLPTDNYFTLYVSPSGDDTNDGRTSQNSVLTLSRVQSILKSVNPASSVQVIIAPGTYYNQKTIWNYTRSQYSVEFTTSPGNEGSAIFDGCPQAGITLPSTSCKGGTFFILSSSTGESTNVIFHGLKIQNYWAGMSFAGNSSSIYNNNWNNRVEYCDFENIGNIFNPSLSYGMYAIQLWNSDQNVISNNTFNNVANINNQAWNHAIYVAVFSTKNTITNNTFNNISGDPIRIRNASNNNTISFNKFTNSGIYGMYSDWYCREDEGNTCTLKECPSWSNVFANNTYGMNYSGKSAPATAVFQSNTMSGCTSPPTGAVRVSTSKNVVSQ